MSEVAGMRVFYGGTFDPVHNGHLAIARAARDALEVEIRVMPAADPPHRPPPGAGVVDRVAMLELAIAGECGLALDLREVTRGGRSWSIDTLEALRTELGGEAPIALLLGADSFVGLPTWKRWRELPGLAHIVVAEREGSPLDGTLPPDVAELLGRRETRDLRELRLAPAGRVLRLNQPLHVLSATELRGRIAAGLPWRHLLPAAVAEYIVAHGLYRDAAVIHP